MRNNKGITLIALVITIIVLLILAGVSLAMLTGDSGILTNADKAKEETEKANLKEQAQMLYMDLKTESYANSENLENYFETATENYIKDNEYLNIKLQKGSGANKVTGTEVNILPKEGTQETLSIISHRSDNGVTIKEYAQNTNLYKYTKEIANAYKNILAKSNEGELTKEDYYTGEFTGENKGLSEECKTNVKALAEYYLTEILGGGGSISTNAIGDEEKGVQGFAITIKFPENDEGIFSLNIIYHSSDSNADGAPTLKMEKQLWK